VPKTHINPEAVAAPRNYSHVVVVDAGRLVFLAGQVPLAPDGSLVGAGDVAEQARQCFRNIRAALEAVGATPDDIIKLTTFVVDFDPSQRDPIIAARDEILGFGEQVPASTLVGVDALALDDFLIEVEAMAIAP
jgi:enamine deaminase RidA (YjgF/YER057c/UK114 family)